MGEKKVTIMILKVDLQCEECYRKVKNVLCKFPQIRDQKYDEKNNQVIIKVVCCSPEKIRDKLCCKGGGVIKCIEIKEPEKPPRPPPPQPKQKPKSPPPQPLSQPPPPPPPQPTPTPPPPPTPTPPPQPLVPACPRRPCCSDCCQGRPGGPCETYPRRPVRPCCSDCYEGRPGGPCETYPRRPVRPCWSDCYEGRPGGPCETYPRRPENTCCTDCYEGRPGGPCETYPPRPVNTCCTDCYEGRLGGPCETGYGYGGPVPYIQYDGHYGRPVYDSYGGGRSSTTSYCVTRPDCFSEENPQACAIM